MLVTSLTLALSLALATPTPISDDTQLCHTANAGFWVKGKSTDVLFDTVRRPTVGKNNYKSPSVETLNTIMTSSVPTIALVSHEHWDHFDPIATMEHLSANPNIQYVMTKGAYNKLNIKGVSADVLDRIHAVYPAADTPQTLTFDDVSLEIYRISHGAGRAENNGYRVIVDGISFFHTGDIDTNRAQLKEAGLTNTPVDYMLLADWYGTYSAKDKQSVLESWNIGTIVPMHLSARAASWMQEFGGLKGVQERAFNTWDNSLRLTAEMACVIASKE